MESDEVVRLGFCVVNGLRQEHAEELVRQRDAFASLDDFKRRVGLTKEELRTLAELGAFNCFAEHRRAALWGVEETEPGPLFGYVLIGAKSRECPRPANPEDRGSEIPPLAAR